MSRIIAILIMVSELVVRRSYYPETLVIPS